MFESGTSGQVGTVAVKVIDNDGATVIGPTTANIAEDGSSGVYLWNAPAAPADEGQYTIIWSIDGTFDEDTVAADDLIIVASTATAPFPSLPAPDDGGYAHGPCTAWTTVEDMAVVCPQATSDLAEFEDFVTVASELLFELSGRQFVGLCQKTVRPCRTGCGCDWQMLSRGYVIWHGDSWSCAGDYCGCGSLSRIELSGYPVREITEVKIDGVAIDPSEYRLDSKRFLTRMNGGAWPACQDLSLPDTASGTWAVTYTYGQSPPAAGIMAATELACAVHQSASGAVDCALPSGVTRLTRQGITIEKNAFTQWGFSNRSWRTGMPLVDLFLNAYNPSGIRRRPIFMTPGKRAYPLNA